MDTILFYKCMCIIVLLHTCLQLGQYTQIRNVLRDPDYAVDCSIWISIDWHANPSPLYPKTAHGVKKIVVLNDISRPVIVI